MNSTPQDGAAPAPTPLDFGSYVQIEQRRFGRPNEVYLYKVVRNLWSNTWVDVPVKGPETESIHSETVEVVACICCGVDETKVTRFRVCDVMPQRPQESPRPTTGAGLDMERLRALMDGLQLENIDQAILLTPELLREIGRYIAASCKDTTAAHNAFNKITDKIIFDSIREATAPRGEQTKTGPAAESWTAGMFTPAAAFANMLRLWTFDQCKGFYAMLSRRPDFNPAATEEAPSPAPRPMKLITAGPERKTDSRYTLWIYGGDPTPGRIIAAESVCNEIAFRINAFEGEAPQSKPMEAPAPLQVSNSDSQLAKAGVDPEDVALMDEHIRMYYETDSTEAWSRIKSRLSPDNSQEGK